MKNDTITKRDLDSIVKNLSDSIKTGFEEARKDRTGIKNALDSGFKTAKQDRQGIRNEMSDMESRLIKKIDESQAELAEMTQNGFNEILEAQQADRKRIDKIIITDLNNLRQRIETIEQALCISK